MVLMRLLGQDLEKKLAGLAIVNKNAEINIFFCLIKSANLLDFKAVRSENKALSAKKMPTLRQFLLEIYRTGRTEATLEMPGRSERCTFNSEQLGKILYSYVRPRTFYVSTLCVQLFQPDSAVGERVITDLITNSSNFPT